MFHLPKGILCFISFCHTAAEMPEAQFEMNIWRLFVDFLFLLQPFRTAYGMATCPVLDLNGNWFVFTGNQFCVGGTKLLLKLLFK